MLCSEVVIAIILFIVGAICRKTQKDFQDYKEAMSKQSDADLRAKIQDEIQPIAEGIHRLQKRIEEVEDKECDDVKIILESYKYRYISLCKRFIAQGYLTQEQNDQAMEMFKVYTKLGGNGQAAEYHYRIMQLPILKASKEDNVE